MYRKGSTVYPEAKKKAFELFDEGMNVPEAYSTLQEEMQFPHLPKDVRYVYRGAKTG